MAVLLDNLRKKKKFKKKVSQTKKNVIYTKSGARLKASSEEILNSIKRDIKLTENC